MRKTGREKIELMTSDKTRYYTLAYVISCTVTRQNKPTNSITNLISIIFVINIVNFKS